jgi:hypothetical protein
LIILAGHFFESALNVIWQAFKLGHR